MMHVSDNEIKQLLIEEAKRKPNEKIFFGGVSFTYGDLALALEGKVESFSGKQKINCLNTYAKKLIKSFREIHARGSL